MKLKTFIGILRESILIENVQEQIKKLRIKFIMDALKRTIPDEQLRKEMALTPPGQPLRSAGGYAGAQLEYLYQDIDTSFSILVQADPSQQKKYLGWLLRWALRAEQNHGIEGMVQVVGEDWFKAQQYLDVLNRGRIRGFDINSVKGLSDLYKVVEPYLQTQTEKQLDKAQRAKINSETRIIYQGPQGMIVSPQSQEASCFWGRGTQWCTAATKNNMFANYANDGPLYIIIVKPQDEDGQTEKYQLHLQTNSFMDSSDYSVPEDRFRKEHPWVVPALNLQVNDFEAEDKFDPASLGWINPDQLKASDISRLIELDPESIMYLPIDPDRAEEYAELAMRSAWEQYEESRIAVRDRHNYRNQNLEHYYSERMTRMRAFALIQGSETAMKFLISKYPQDILRIKGRADEQLWWIAIKADPDMITKMDNEYTEEMWKYVIERDPWKFGDLDKFRDPEHAAFALKQGYRGLLQNDLDYLSSNYVGKQRQHNFLLLVHMIEQIMSSNDEEDWNITLDYLDQMGITREDLKKAQHGESLGESQMDDQDDGQFDHLPMGKGILALRPEMIARAQQVYNDWDESDQDTYAGGGICHLIADELVEVLNQHGYNAGTVSANDEVHVYAVVQAQDGIWTVDIPHYLYERGGGYSWTKLPEVQFTPDDISLYHLDGDPASLNQYTDWE